MFGGWRWRDWRLVAMVAGGVAVLLLVLPVWTYGDDAGWYSCGTLWNQDDGVGLGCEYGGSFRHRLWWVYGFAAAAFVASGVGLWRRRAEPTAARSAAVLAGGLVVAIAAGAGLWTLNDGVYVAPTYDFSDTTLTVAVVAAVATLPGLPDSADTYRLHVRADGWPSTGVSMFAACRSTAVPGDCDLTYASGDVTRPDPDGVLDAEIELRIPPDTIGLIGFDAEQSRGLDEPSWPRSAYVMAAVEPAGFPADLPVVDRSDGGPAVTLDATTVAPSVDEAGGSAPSEGQPVGFEQVRATVTTPDGEVCELCLWLAATADQRARGLMEVTDLGPADGMAFVYPEPRTGNFWMKNTLLPLSIAFYAPDGGFLGAFDMEPCESDPCPLYRTAPDFVVAVETLQGQLGDLGIVFGSTLDVTTLPCP